MRTEAFWLETEVLAPGRLAVSPRPRGGDWLGEEVRAWRIAGVDHVVSLLTPGEVEELELGDERSSCRSAGVEFSVVPIEDRGVPGAAGSFVGAAQGLAQEVRAGSAVLVHCRQGIGRASMMATAILAHLGVDPGSAIELIEHARGRPVPDTEEQREWLVRELEPSRLSAQQAAAADERRRGGGLAHQPSSAARG